VDVFRVEREGETGQRKEPVERIKVGGHLAGHGGEQLGDPPPVPVPASRLALQFLEEGLLALHTREVAAGVVAETDEVEGVVAPEQLVPGGDVDGFPGAALGVVVATVDRVVDAAEDIDDVPEAAEVHLDEVVDRQPRELANGLDAERRPAVRVGDVDLVVAVPGKLDVQIPGKRQHGDALRVGIEAHEQEGIGSARVPRTRVAADQEDVHRFVGQWRTELVPGMAHRRCDRAAAIAHVAERPVRPPKGEAGERKDHGDHGEPDDLHGKAPSVRKIGRHGGAGGGDRDGRADQQPVRHPARRVREIEDRPEVLERPPAQVPEDDRCGSRRRHGQKPQEDGSYRPPSATAMPPRQRRQRV